MNHLSVKGGSDELPFLNADRIAYLHRTKTQVLGLLCILADIKITKNNDHRKTIFDLQCICSNLCHMVFVSGLGVDILVKCRICFSVCNCRIFSLACWPRCRKEIAKQNRRLDALGWRG